MITTVKTVTAMMVIKMSTGMEAMVVTSPEIIDATKWQKIPSCGKSITGSHSSNFKTCPNEEATSL